MITLTSEEVQQVLDALGSCEEDWIYNGEDEYCVDSYDHALVSKAFELLRARLSAPEPPCKTGSQCIGGKCPQCVVSEPVAWMNESDIGKTDWKVWAHGKPTATMPLYAAPPKPEPSVEPVAWHEPGAYGNVTVYQKWAEENGWLPLYTAPSQKNA